MEMYIQFIRNDSYGTIRKHMSCVSFEKYLKHISNILEYENYEKTFGSISSCVSRCRFPILRYIPYYRNKFDTHLMVLDCDGTDHMLAAAHTLKKKNIGYALIQSSQGDSPHYWIVTDYMGTFDEVLMMVWSIPGVDSEWVFYASALKRFMLRGMSLPYKVPIFQDPSGLKNKIAIDFYNQFYNLINHPIIISRLEAEILNSCIKAKTISTMVSNPEFIL